MRISTFEFSVFAPCVLPYNFDDGAYPNLRSKQPRGIYSKLRYPNWEIRATINQQ